jgi:hypothetical protein
MPSENVKEIMSQAEQNQMLYAAIVFPLARMIYSEQIDPETVTRDELVSALVALGKSDEEPFEFHVCRVKEEMRLVAHCVSEGEAKSGVVLLFTLLEGEINTLVRIHLRIRGYSKGAITTALRGTDLDTKLDVLLPLLEVVVPERLRNIVHQCKAIRNLVVHNKAAPNEITDDGIKDSDSEIAGDRAKRFFSENPIPRLQADIEKFFDEGVETSEAIQWSRHLFTKYHEAESQ